MSTPGIRVRGLGGRAHWGPARLEGRPLILLASTLAAFAVFGCFYGIGRATRSTHALPQPSYTPPQQRAGGVVRAGISNGLVAPTPIPAPVPFKAARSAGRSRTVPAGRSTFVPAPGSSTAFRPEVSRASPRPPASISPPAPARTPSPSTTAPAPSPTVSRPPHQPAASGQPAGGHGSFDTSG
jgi:hypothetical protein